MTGADLLFMHAFSGCDTVSSFSGIGKKTVWDVWRFVPNLTALNMFGHLSQTPQEITDDKMDRCMAQLKLYSANSDMMHDSHQVTT